ncbi:snRNA-activating protein complex subunit 2 [Xyrichtys novacula]|uniref:snRNA-activating protein complex subunit 2 n=1 Tax=Xyrichtys novacula TaxID=13765 RepID=A0AAV1HQ56_XYRNO|nr:snRNA-activating protein complex subunit 2 [Xyrichtys novacula]
MKPPPRKRNKPERTQTESVHMRSGKWQRAELRRLLAGLRTQNRNAAEHGDIDYSALKKQVKTRSETEIRSVVDALKEKVISSASYVFKKREREERMDKKPIQLWTEMASSVTGTIEETINAAFSQMLIVSSTEPSTHRNSDPPKVPGSITDQNRPAGRTVPFRPVPRPASGPGVRPGTSHTPPHMVMKTPALIVSPARRLPAPSQVVPIPATKVSTPQTQPGPGTGPGAPPAPSQVVPIPATKVSTPQTQPGPGAPPCQTANALSHPTRLTTVTTPVTPTPNSAAEGQTTCPPLSSSPSAPSPVSYPSSASLIQPTHPPPSGSAAALCARFGRTSKHATEDSPRALGVKCVVDFERIYKYLSFILKPDEECPLTPMEGAIMLDLLMSLPEELPKLDCNGLRKHLRQAYQSLSSSSDSRAARDLFKDLQDRPGAQTESPAVTNMDRPDTQQNPAGPADIDKRGVTQQPQEAETHSSASNTTANQDADISGVCPPLNPFMVPLKLLKRREIVLQSL